MKELYELLLESRSHLAPSFLEKYSKLFEPEHLRVLSQNMQNYYQNGIPATHFPKFSLECTPPLAESFAFFESALTMWERQETHEQEELCKAFAKALMNATTKHILILMGQRLSPASITNESAIPPTKTQLITTAMIKNKEKLSEAARAWTKHAHRSPEKFWGEVKGTTNAKNVYVQNLLEHLIANKTWWNVFRHHKHAFIYEIRISSGHGARWLADASKFIGFVEPFDPATGKSFERNSTL